MLEEDVRSGNLDNRFKYEIATCKYLIADLSHEKGGNINLNVIYEIGLANGFGKNVSMIMEENLHEQYLSKIETPNLPFDISKHTIVSYSNENIEESISSILSAVFTEIEN